MVGQHLPIFRTKLLPMKQIDYRFDKEAAIDQYFPFLNILNILSIFLQDFISSKRNLILFPIDQLISINHFIGVFIGSPADHTSHQFRVCSQDFVSLVQSLNPSVYGKSEVREILGQFVNQFVFQRRHIAILSGIQPLQEGFPGMNYEMFDFPFFRNFLDEIFDKIVAVELINTQPAFDSAINISSIDRSPDRLHAFRHKLFLFHQTGSKRTFLDPRTGTADIQIQLIIAMFFCKDGCLGQQFGITATQLKDHGVFDWVEWQLQSRAMKNGIVVDHLCVEGGFAGQQPGEVAVMGVRYVEHWSYADQWSWEHLHSGFL